MLVVALVAALAAGCGASRAFRRAESLAMQQQWDEAVEYYRQALQQVARPARIQDRARAGDAVGGDGPRPAGPVPSRTRAGSTKRCASTAWPASSIRRTGRLPRAPPNSTASCATGSRRRGRGRRSSRCASRCGARTQEPTLNPSSRDPLNLRFANTSLRDLLNFIGSATGINVTYDRDFQDRSVTVQLEGVTLEQALQQVMRLESDLLQGDERADDHRRHRQHRQAAAVPRNRSSRRSSCRTPTPPSWRSWSTP